MANTSWASRFWQMQAIRSIPVNDVMLGKLSVVKTTKKQHKFKDDACFAYKMEWLVLRIFEATAVARKENRNDQGGEVESK